MVNMHLFLTSCTMRRLDCKRVLIMKNGLLEISDGRVYCVFERFFFNCEDLIFGCKEHFYQILLHKKKINFVA